VSGARGLDPPVPPGLHGSAASFTDRTGRGLYVYCITEAEEPLDLGLAGLGEGGGPVFSVHHGGLAAVVSEALPIECRPTRENLLTHELVNEAVMRRHASIPLSFGTLFGTEADVAAMLRSAGGALSEILGVVRGKIELGLKVTWDREKALAQLEAEDPELRELKGEIGRVVGGSPYASRARFGRLVERALEARGAQLTRSVYEALQPLAVATRANKLVGDDMILNAAFLVESAREDDFNRAVEGLTSRYGDVLAFRYTGPWPPYSFVNLRLKLESEQGTG